MADTKKIEEGSSRWWEFYAVRYAMGTVVGAAVLYLLVSKLPDLRPLMFEPEGVSKGDLGPLYQLDSTRLILLGVCGLVFCYVASAPVLVLHSARFLLAGRVKLSRWWTWTACVVAPMMLTAWSFYEVTPKNVLSFMTSVLLLTVLALIGLQYTAVVLVLGNRQELFAFYSRLATARVDAKGGITDSYRHLREHGNSFFIVLLEVLLGALLYAAGAVSGEGTEEARPFVFILILVLWIVPAALVWGVGTLFELTFSASNQNSP